MAKRCRGFSPCDHDGFAGSLSHRWETEQELKNIDEKQASLLGTILDQLELGIQGSDPGVVGMIKVSFIEPIYEENKHLFEYLLSCSGRLLRYEMLAHKTELNGQMICTVIKHIYGPNPPSTLGEMCNNPIFVQMISAVGISLTQEAVLDLWDKPYRFSVKVMPEGQRTQLCVVSLAKLRDFGVDIESCLAVD